ncbi:NodB-like proteiny domain-containing protein [Mycena sanguinolenta]|uniref:chitin deacetylase n=1 Tax=Mycena sanguinolenta TaxID=230812 RepID=A0A8H7DDE3_9AGAR|nr:NodB-like proteiny domain-containing protein [Mycena sanguinolenta]
MKPHTTIATLFSLLGLAVAHDPHIAKRQSASAAAGTVVAGVTVPPLASITFGMPTATTPAATATATPGASPPFAGAPQLPSPAWAFTPGQWPDMDKPIDATTEQVQEWMKELDGYDIPDIEPTVDGSCVNDTGAFFPPLAKASQAAKPNPELSICLAAAAGCRKPRVVDLRSPGALVTTMDQRHIVRPFTNYLDDLPTHSSTAPNLLGYLEEKNISATFFVVGSRVIEYPGILINEYMAGHEIGVHTWSHPHLTSLTNAQIVAELGWTRKAIQDVLGVTPTIMRPPYGDIDDRVRMISLAMGMVPVIWTHTDTGYSFDTFDWMVAGGSVTGVDSFNQFENILGNASTLSTGFCVLEHDLYEITVDLAIGYTLNAALTHNPPFTLEAIGKCSKIPTANLYVESNTNKTFPFPSPPASMASNSSSSSSNSSAGSNSSSNGKVAHQGSATGSSGAPRSLVLSLPFSAAALALGSLLVL